VALAALRGELTTAQLAAENVTSPRFTGLLRHAGIRISMDGRGRWLDNVFIERLWRSLTYECVYLHAFKTGSELRAGLSRWIGCCNARRPPLVSGRAHARRGMRGGRDSEIAGLTTTGTKLVPAAKLSDGTGPPLLNRRCRHGLRFRSSGLLDLLCRPQKQARFGELDLQPIAGGDVQMLAGIGWQGEPAVMM
jgi:putative transposase